MFFTFSLFYLELDKMRYLVIRKLIKLRKL